MRPKAREVSPEGTDATSAARWRWGVRGNERLTSGLGALLFAMLAVEGFTLLGLHQMLTWHVVIGMALLPPVALKTVSTTHRMISYYRGDPAYREKGPPAVVLRLLGPFVVVLTLAVIGTGVALVLVPLSLRTGTYFLHKATFVLWFGAMTIHVLGHVFETAEIAPLDWLRRTRRDVAGAGLRRWLLVSSLAAGLVVGVLFAPQAAHFLAHGGNIGG